MNEYTITSTSRTSANVEEEFILEENSTTRRIFKAMIVKSPGETIGKVKGSIIHQRKSPTAQWEVINEIKLSQLKSGDGISLNLPSEQIEKLYQALVELRAIAERGIEIGQKKVIVADKDTIVQVIDTNHKAVIQELIQRDLGGDFWEELSKISPDSAKNFSLNNILIERANALAIYKLHLDALDWSEAEWEDFFDKNDWIFGYGLSYQFLGILQRQVDYQGGNITGKGGQRGDFLTATGGQSGFVVPIEIKKPDTLLFAGNQTRSGVEKFSNDLIEAISQIQVNTRTLDTETSRTEANREYLEEHSANVFNPKSILIISHTSQLDTTSKMQTFESFRRNLVNPEIITFDELYQRASYIVQHKRI